MVSKEELQSGTKRRGAPIGVGRRQEVITACLDLLVERYRVGDLFPSLEKVNDELRRSGSTRDVSKGLWRELLDKELAQYVGKNPREGGRPVVRVLPTLRAPSSDSPVDRFWDKCEAIVRNVDPKTVSRVLLKVNWFDRPKKSEKLLNHLSTIIESYDGAQRPLEMLFILQNPCAVDAQLRRIAGQVDSYRSRCSGQRYNIADRPEYPDYSNDSLAVASDLYSKAIISHNSLLDDYKDMLRLAGRAQETFHRPVRELRGMDASSNRDLARFQEADEPHFEVAAFSGWESFPSLMVSTREGVSRKHYAMMGMYPIAASGAQSPILSNDTEWPSLNKLIFDTVEADFAGSWIETVPAYIINDSYRRKGWADEGQFDPYYVTPFGLTCASSDGTQETLLQRLCESKAQNFSTIFTMQD